MIGLIAQVVLLAGIAGSVGLGTAGWLVGLAYGIAVCAFLVHGLNRAGGAGSAGGADKDALGPADKVTLARAILVGGVTALAVESLSRPVPVQVLVGLTIGALLLDAVDGYVARRTGTSSDLGARFDMEVDAFLLLVLSVYLLPQVGAWVLAIGAMRYAFVLGLWTLPWMRTTLPPRYWRKVVAATQGVALVVGSAGVLPRTLTVAGLLVALTLLVESFGRDVLWLYLRPDLRQPLPIRGWSMVEPATVGAHPVLLGNGGYSHGVPSLRERALEESHT
jgi:phosphatidylglycerophosphate synthase